MNINVDDDDNWDKCPKCGKLVFIDPNTGKSEPCSTCVSMASKSVGAFSVVVSIAGITAIVGLLYFCIRLLW